MSTICEHCGASLGEGSAFCTECGTRRSANPGPAGARRFCTNCGAAIATGARFCTGCGAPAEAAGTPAAAPRANVNEPRRPAAGSPASGAVPQPAIQAVPGKSASWLPKVIIAGGVIVVLFVVAITASVIYVAHRVKRKAAELEAASSVASLKAAAADAASGSPSKPSRTAAGGSSRPAAPYGWTLKDGKLVPAPPPASKVPAPPVAAPMVPVSATGDTAHDWALKYERTENGPEADLVVRTGDINNLGFGWPQGFDPFSGKSTPPHQWPDANNIPAGAPDGTDRIMIGTAVTPGIGDGYSGALGDCALEKQLAANGPVPPATTATLEASCKRMRQLTMPTPIVLDVGALPPKIDAVVVQMFVDDFQPVPMRSHFQVSLNGTRIPSFEYAINALDQSGPIGKLLTLRLLPEYWPLLKSGTVKLLFDDPTTHVPDGYAIDFVRILVNPHQFKYQVSLAATVTDADKHTPIAGATVSAGLGSATTDPKGKCQLNGLPAGLVIATAAAPGYDENSVTADLVSGQSGSAEIQLHRHQEGTADLERAIQQTGSATVYGIHFDTDSAKLRPDSMPALNAVLGLINNHPGSRWIIAGHTDNQGSAAHNQALSENRSGSVIAWLKGHGVAGDRLVAQGFGATRPVADNATANGRALNRRVEVAPAK
jgi:OOP family OmpA-OmpF porin